MCHEVDQIGPYRRARANLWARLRFLERVQFRDRENGPGGMKRTFSTHLDHTQFELLLSDDFVLFFEIMTS